MRIALVHPYPWPEVRRGAERYVEDLTVHLAASGHQVTVITATRGRPGRTTRPDGAAVWQVRHLPPGPLHRLGVGEVETFGLGALVALLRRQVDVVHALTPTAALAGRLAGRPTVYSVLGHPSPEQLPVAAVPRRLFVAAARSATVTAALSQASQQALAATTGRVGLVLPPGVRLERFPPAADPRCGPPRLLFSASLHDRRKRLDLVLGAVDRLLDRHPQLRLALSGQGDAAAALAGCPPRVRAVVDPLGPGDPDEVPGRYRQATVTVLPADHEAFGLVLVESLASGTPVVCGPGGGMAEIVTPAVGRVAAASTAGAVAEAVDQAIALAGQLSTSARCVQRAADWDWDGVVGPAHRRLYAALAAGRPAPAGEGTW